MSEAAEMRLTLRKQSIVLYPFDEVETHAFDLANATGRALYDCLYLALAILIDGVMVTAARRFYHDLAATPMGGRVHWVTEVPARHLPYRPNRAVDALLVLFCLLAAPVMPLLLAPACLAGGRALAVA